MTEDKFEDYLKQRHANSVNYYDRQAGKNKRLYHAFQWGVIIISAVMPVIVVSYSQEYKMAAAGLSLLLAIGTAALKAFKFQENWLNFRQMAEALQQEKYFYTAELGTYRNVNDDDRRSLFVDRVESLISREHAIWTNLHQQKEAPAKGSPSK